MPASKILIHTFGGQHFDVIVWQGVESGSYDAFIRAHPDSDATIFKGVIECSAAQLGELQKLSKLAQMLIDHLEAGMAFACWTELPNHN